MLASRQLANPALEKTEIIAECELQRHFKDNGFFVI